MLQFGSLMVSGAAHHHDVITNARKSRAAIGLLPWNYQKAFASIGSHKRAPYAWRYCTCSRQTSTCSLRVCMRCTYFTLHFSIWTTKIGSERTWWCDDKKACVSPSLSFYFVFPINFLVSFLTAVAGRTSKLGEEIICRNRREREKRKEEKQKSLQRLRHTCVV